MKTKDYGRGYNAGVRNRWPEHKPPHPPTPAVAELMKAASKLRDDADWLCSVIEQDDEWYQRLSPGIEAVDAALVKISEWLKLSESNCTLDAQPATRSHELQAGSPDSGNGCSRSPNE